MEEDSSEGLANFIQITEMENKKKNSLLNILGTGKKNILTLFWGFLLSATKGKRTEKDVKVSHRYPDYIHRKIWGNLQIIKTENSERLLNVKGNTQSNNLTKNFKFLKILVTF